ncbi:hypothetical protein CDD81_2904 [Ophiocordyceps australis]|uniref:Zn(2)-C6 fungal-type domain-containing protein n=1 Tax=Ophiocordyceps australis TaxID=1399860 RepID=A0A2C5YC99_9HYPO|nr:hypothetical protein CDD81_2904 [Ophiocordyceps australis]
MKQKTPTTRRKACHDCARSKVRCSLQRPSCSNCASAGRVCRYATPAEPGSSNGPLEMHSRHATRDQLLDFSKLDLAPFDDAEQIRQGWMRSFLATPEQAEKTMHDYTLQYIGRILCVYAKQMALKAHGPPMLHATQMAEGQRHVDIANCSSLVRLWLNRASGSESMVAEAVKREMERLSLAHGPDCSASPVNVLASFQAHLVYSILASLLPMDKDTTALVNDSTMAALQHLAFRTAQTGLVSRGEEQGFMPQWESWIVAAAKRRSLLVFYLFSNVYNAANSMPNFIADELRDVPAPDARLLWEADTRHEWQSQYAQHLARWHDGPLRISELWRSQHTGSSWRRERIERWLETVDDFGMMVFSVCAHVHGC